MSDLICLLRSRYSELSRIFSAVTRGVAGGADVM